MGAATLPDVSSRPVAPLAKELGFLPPEVRPRRGIVAAIGSSAPEIGRSVNAGRAASGTRVLWSTRRHTREGIRNQLSHPVELKWSGIGIGVGAGRLRRAFDAVSGHAKIAQRQWPDKTLLQFI
jgi:hypothetical protein